MGVQSLLMEGEHLVAALELESAAFPAELQALQDEYVERFVVRRQEIVAAIQKFDSNCTCFLGRSVSFAEMPATLMELRERLGKALSRVIETDRLLLALAEREKARLKIDLTAIATGRLALGGYGTKERQPSASLDRTA
jgi:precorrin-6B methylase 2